jgi:hypothetical protein
LCSEGGREELGRIVVLYRLKPEHLELQLLFKLVLEENRGSLPPFKLVLEEYKGLEPPFKLVLGEEGSCSFLE